jgi:aryl-alcohol dehydrogenase-like predicted oxidoreductase
MLGKPFEWDACQFPVNVLDLHYRSFQKQVLPVCLKNKVGAIGMKGFGGGNGIAREAGLSPEEAYRFALSQPVASQVVGMTTMEHLQQNVALARNFKPLSEGEQSTLAERVKPVATDGRFEQFKSTQNFDGPVHRRQHGFRA